MYLCLTACASALKSVGLVVVLSPLMTRKLLMFLSRLHAVSGGCEKIEEGRSGVDKKSRG